MLHVRRGDEVKQGDLLISLDSPELEAQLDALHAARNQAQAQLDESLHGTREESIRALKASLAQAEAELRNAESDFQRNQQMVERGFLSRTQFDLSRRERDVARDRVAEARANLDEGLKGDREGAARRCRPRCAGPTRRYAERRRRSRRRTDQRLQSAADAGAAGRQLLVFNLREDILAKVRKGDRIVMQVPGLGGAEVETELRYIAPLGDFSTRRATRATGDFDLKTFETRFYPVAADTRPAPGHERAVALDERAMAWAALKRNASRFVQAFNTETRIACRSWTIHWLGWCWPLLLFGVISGVYQAGTLLDMPLAVDKDHSQLSRKLIRELDATSTPR